MVHDLTRTQTWLLAAALQIAAFGVGDLNAQSAALDEVSADYAEAKTAAPGDWNLQVPATTLFGEISTEDKRVVGTFTGGLTPRFQWTAKVSGPLDKDDSTTPVRLADLNGLRNAATAALALTYEYWKPSANAGAELKWCSEFWAQDANLPAAAVARRKAIEADATLSDQEKSTRSAAVVDSVARSNCVLSKIPPQHRAAFDEAGQVDYGRPFRMSAQLEGGMLDFRYVDTGTGNEIKGGRRPWALSLSANYYVPGWRTLFAVGARREESHEAAQQIQYCTPIGTAGASQCRSTAFAAPVEKNATIAQVEVRTFVTEYLGVSPRIIRDFTDGVTGVELPILIRKRGDEGFQSGLVLGWRSDDEAVVLSAFVGKVFGLQAGF